MVGDSTFVSFLSTLLFSFKFTFSTASISIQVVYFVVGVAKMNLTSKYFSGLSTDVAKPT